MSGRGKAGGGAKSIFRPRLVAFHKHQAEVQVGFENGRIGVYGFLVGQDRVVRFVLRVIDEAQIEPCLIVCSIFVEHAAQKRLGGRVVPMLDCGLGLSQCRRLRRIFDCNLVMTYGCAAVGGLSAHHSGQSKIHAQQKQPATSLRWQCVAHGRSANARDTFLYKSREARRFLRAVPRRAHVRPGRRLRDRGR
jgi:hypothetical protein